MIDRRTFIAGTGAVLLAAPLAAEAQQPRKTVTIGILAPYAPYSGRPAAEDVFERSLQDLGWISGRNVRIEIRTPVGPEGAVATPAAELIALGVDVLVVWGTVGALAAKQATSKIPVVFLGTGDPVSLGLVSSLAHPGGNLTGVTAIASSEEFAKRLELLKEAVPSVARVALLVSPDGRTLMNLNRQMMTVSAKALGIELREVDVQTPEGMETAVRKAKGQGAQALYIWPSAIALASRKQMSDLALENRLPSIHPFTENAMAGGLLSYSASLSHIAQRGALYVDKILKGAKPADLPVEQPTKFELVINLKTAKALGLTIPPSLLGRADELIQ